MGRLGKYEDQGRCTIIALLLTVLLWGDDLVLQENRLGLPVSILTAVDIREQLDSGLTTTFLLTVSDGGEERLLARIELRYEPWDEVFYVRLGQADGTVQEVTFANFERLSRWWSTPFLALPEQARAGRRWTLTLAVIPFSFVERDDARRWLIGNPRPNVDGDTISDGGGAVMGSLLATSIRREPMLRFRWKIK